MPDILETVFFNILEISLAMSAVIAAVLVFSRLFGDRFKARCRYIIWIIIALRLLVPLNINIPEPLSIMQKSGDVKTVSNAVVTSPVINEVNHGFYSGSAALYEEPDSYNSSGKDEFSVMMHISDAAELFTLIWMTGALLHFTVTFAGYLKLQHRLRRWSRPASEHVFDILEIKRVGYRINRILHVYVSDEAASPMLCGFFRPAVVLPPNDLDDARMNAALGHELIHLRRGDLWIKLLVSAALSIHWFNPLVHIMNRYAAQDIEFSCDEEALEGCDDEARRIYADALLIFIRNERAKKLPLTTQFDTRKKPILRRFDRILNNRRLRNGTALTFVAGVLTVCLAGCISIGGTRRYTELPDARYFMSEGLVYTTSDDTESGRVTSAYEYRMRRYIPLKAAEGRIILNINGSDTDYGYYYYVSESGKIIKASLNDCTPGVSIGNPFDFPEKPMLCGTREYNLAITYTSDNKLYTVIPKSGEHISLPGKVRSESSDDMHIICCLPISYSPDGNRMLYIGGTENKLDLYCYSFSSGENELVFDGISAFGEINDGCTADFVWINENEVFVVPYSPESEKTQGYLINTVSKEHMLIEDIESITDAVYKYYPDEMLFTNSISQSGKYIWFTDSGCTRLIRVSVDGMSLTDVTELDISLQPDAEKLFPVGPLSDDLFLMCEALKENGWRCIILDFRDGNPKTADEPTVTSQIVGRDETTKYEYRPPESTIVTQNIHGSYEIPKLPPRETSPIQPVLPEITPDRYPSEYELRGASMLTVIKHPDGDIINGEGSIDDFISAMNAGSPADLHVVVYTERILNDTVYHVAELWYELIYDGNRASFISYSYTADENSGEFRLSAYGPENFSTIESIYTRDSSGRLYHDYYFNKASDKRMSRAIIRLPVNEAKGSVQPIYPDEGGFPLEWYVCHSCYDWLAYGTDTEGLSEFIALCRENNEYAESFKVLLDAVEKKLGDAEILLQENSDAR